MPIYSHRLQGWSAIADTFVTFFAHLPGCFWLDRSHNDDSNFTIIGAGVATDNPILKVISTHQSDLPFDFLPHLVGVLDYRVKETDELKGNFLSVDRAFVYDHKNRAMFFVGEFENQTEHQEWLHGALLRLALLGGDGASYSLQNPSATCARLEIDTKKDSYLMKISKAKAAISQGEIYQLCLTTRLRGPYSGNPLSYFLRLRKEHSAPYASYMKIAGTEYVSISPESAIRVSGIRVSSSPIKGTAARGETEARDLENLEYLATDPKERAENLMIVDLIRNDLGKVCRPESVIVESLLQVQSFSTVHQLVSKVSGQLRADQDGFDALAVLSPGGSMTGAPKIAAMAIIEELEDSPRAGYSGAMGWIGPNGDMDLAMVIRTAVFKNGEVTIGIGGGITSDSNPNNEHDEIKLKAKALVEGLGATLDW